MAAKTTKTKTTNAPQNDCIIKCNHLNLAAGYTRVKITPSVYPNVIMIAGMTGRTLQDVVNELLTYAIGYVKIEQADGVIRDFNVGGKEV